MKRFKAYKRQFVLERVLEPQVNEVLNAAIINSLLMVASAHIWHFQESSFAAHEAWGDFYEKLDGLVDDLAECAIGEGLMFEFSEEDTFNLYPLEAANEVMASFQDDLETLNESLASTPSVQNVLQDILSLCAKTAYRLEQLS